MQYSNNMNEVKGTAEQQVAQLRIQMIRMQEETEDALRNMKRDIQALKQQLEAQGKVG